MDIYKKYKDKEKSKTGVDHEYLVVDTGDKDLNKVYKAKHLDDLEAGDICLAISEGDDPEKIIECIYLGNMYTDLEDLQLIVNKISEARINAKMDEDVIYFIMVMNESTKGGKLSFLTASFYFKLEDTTIENCQKLLHGLTTSAGAACCTLFGVSDKNYKGK